MGDLLIKGRGLRNKLRLRLRTQASTAVADSRKVASHSRAHARFNVPGSTVTLPTRGPTTLTHHPATRNTDASGDLTTRGPVTRDPATRGQRDSLLLALDDAQRGDGDGRFAPHGRQGALQDEPQLLPEVLRQPLHLREVVQHRLQKNSARCLKEKWCVLGRKRGSCALNTGASRRPLCIASQSRLWSLGQ